MTDDPSGPLVLTSLRALHLAQIIHAGGGLARDGG